MRLWQKSMPISSYVGRVLIQSSIGFILIAGDGGERRGVTELSKLSLIAASISQGDPYDVADGVDFEEESVVTET